MPNGRPVEGSYYFYAPSKISPPFFIFAFFISTLTHLWQCYQYKCFKITGYHIFCGLLFTTGFALREYGAFNYDNLNIYIASTLLIYMSPPILELANYHVLGRVMYYIPYFAPLHPGRVITTFGFLSSVVEALNAIGISYLANRSLPEKYGKLGDGIMKASLILQVVVIALFCLLAGIFHYRCVKSNIKKKSVWDPLITLYISMSLILIRTIYRMIEHFGVTYVNSGVDFDPMSLTPLIRYEWFFYIFEATLMLWNTCLWNVRHPRRPGCPPEDYRVYLAQDGVTEIKGPGWNERKGVQGFVLSLVDPFGLINIGKSKEKPFWEADGVGGPDAMQEMQRLRYSHESV
ncbi:hypothetical protein CC78DRAFT_517247 [Lojkania enalia]|uniref:RTA1 domain protein n=1 Tax=Lojkania enalia TaxID=147567 RepID=A0A9P4KAK7_9PLEO|nr:hypothetical protein CC78DRAFT_517247 [Didymosphaeria enalia]